MGVLKCPSGGRPRHGQHPRLGQRLAVGGRPAGLDGDYTQIGIGVVRRGSRVWITQVFRRPTGGASTKQRSRRGSGERTAQAGPPRPAPTPTELLRRRISTARAALPAQPPADPLAAALGFAQAMRTVGA